MTAVLWLHVVGIGIGAAIASADLLATALTCAVLGGFAVVGSLTRLPSRWRADAVTLGLLGASGAIVGLAGGASEAHFHLFLVVAVLALYEDWTPYLLAVTYEVAAHGIGPPLVHGDADPHASLGWVVVHAAFILAACAASVTAWRLNEESRRNVEDTHRHSRLVLDTAHDAFISIDEAGEIVAWNAQAQRTLGWSWEEVRGRLLSELLIPERYRHAYQDALDRVAAGERGPSLGRRLELGAIHRDGHELPVEMRISAIPQNGSWTFHAFLHDISDRRRAERYRDARLAVTRVLADSPSPDEALPRVLESIGDSLAWQFGAFWIVAPDHVLRCRHVWRARQLGGHELETLTRSVALELGQGVPGEAWRLGRPVWVADVAGHENPPRARAAAQAGLTSAHAVPVTMGSEVLGVLEFFCEEAGAEDHELLEILAAFGAQIGSFVRRKRAEEALRDNDEFREALLESLEEGVVACDARGDLTVFNRAARQMHGVPDAWRVGEDDIALDDLYSALEEAPLFQALSGTSVDNLEMVMAPAGHPARTVLVSARPIATRDGRTLGAVVAYRDITERKRREEVHRNLAAIVESSSDAMMRSTLSGVVASWNAGAERLFGYSAEEAIGEEVGILAHRDAEYDSLHLLQEVRRGHSVSDHETVRLRKDGRPIDVSLTASPIRDERGEVSGVSVLARDITERNRIESEVRASRNTLQSVLDNATAVIYAKDLDGRFIFVNRRFEEGAGLRPGEAVGKTDHELGPSEFVSIGRANDAKAVAARAPIEFEEVAAMADGEHTFVSVRFPLLDEEGTPYAVCGMSTDVTQRRRIDDELASSLDAERASQAKTEFLSRVSHELRTPLNAILGFAQLLELEDLSHSAQEGVEQILMGGRHLLDLIDEVLQISLIESGRLEISLDAVPVYEVVNEAVDLVGALAGKRRIRLIKELGTVGDEKVEADRQRLKQVMLNVLSNAVKYNRDGGTVEVGARRDDERLTITVRDTGHGIAPERLAKLYHPFERLGAEQTGVAGTGLGLSVSKSLLDAMGGEISLTSRPGEGTQVAIRLAVAHSAVRDTTTAPPFMGHEPSGAAAEGRTLLHVEDNPSNRMLVERIFADRPEIVLLAAHDGRTGLALARERQPDLILLDLHLPDVSGRAVLRDLRSDPRTESIPVVVVTADATASHLAASEVDGAQACHTKPLDVQALRATIERELVGTGGSDVPA